MKRDLKQVYILQTYNIQSGEHLVIEVYLRRQTLFFSFIYSKQSIVYYYFISNDKMIILKILIMLNIKKILKTIISNINYYLLILFLILIIKKNTFNKSIHIKYHYGNCL